MNLAKEASTKNSAIKLGIYSCVQAIVIDSLSVYIPHAQLKNHSNFPLCLCNSKLDTVKYFPSKGLQILLYFRLKSTYF